MDLSFYHDLFVFLFESNVIFYTVKNIQHEVKTTWLCKFYVSFDL